jgi:hypothetical protein
MGGVEEGDRGAKREDGASCGRGKCCVRRLWKVDDDGRIPTWVPGTTGFLGDCLNEDDELQQLIEGVASAGSWAVWMGVFSRSWMKLLV